MTKYSILILVLLTFISCAKSQPKTCSIIEHKTDTLSLLFIGDIMGHTPQISSAKQDDGTYNYDEVFKYLETTIEDADIAIANLELTLAGKPFKGYPQFSSPDNLASAIQRAGIDVLVTANNHSVDRGKQGILRTINVLDSLEICHSGTFKTNKEKKYDEPLLIEEKGFKIALLNYTYGTNGLAIPYPTVVNINDPDSLQKDINKAKSLNPDKIILFIHWGTEYQRHPDEDQINLAEFCFNQGVDIIIGSHPHVIQKSEWLKNTDKEQFITYSLGNLVSNQRKRFTDGGQMIKITLQKENEVVSIKDGKYILTWVYTPTINNKKQYYVLPCTKYITDSMFFTKIEDFNKMNLFISDSRKLLNNENKNVIEETSNRKKPT